MRPARGEQNVPVRGERLEPGIPVDLEDAAESVQMSRRPLRLAVRAVEVDGRRRVRSGPGAIVARIDPQPARPRLAAAGIEHRDRRIVGEQLIRGEDMGGKARALEKTLRLLVTVLPIHALRISNCGLGCPVLCLWLMVAA
jgi:hypothetical protein